MIIFFDKKTGYIEGYISGEKHYRGEENFWVGDKNKTERIFYDKTAPFYNEAIKNFSLRKNFKINTETFFLEPRTLSHKL